MTCKILKYSLVVIHDVKTFQCMYIDQDNNHHIISLTNNIDEDSIEYIRDNVQKEFDHYFVDEPKEIHDLVEDLYFFDFDIPKEQNGIIVFEEDKDGSSNE